MGPGFLRTTLINLDLILQAGVVVGLILVMTPWQKWGQRILIFTLIPLFIIILTPFGPWLMAQVDIWLPPSTELSQSKR